jgi:hypothetical protein
MLVVSREKIQYLVVRLRIDPHASASCARQATKFAAESAFLLYNLSGLAHNLCFRYPNRKDERLSMQKAMWRAMTGAIFFLVAVFAVSAQQLPAGSRDPNLPTAPQPVGNSAPADQNKTGESATASAPLVPTVHSFWDRENDWLFAGVGAGRALDYASTLNLRRRGIDEVFLTNSIVDNHPLFAGIEIGATAASIGVSYIFHRTGHHRLEHWTSAIHAGVAVGGAIRNYALKTPHPK